MKTDDSNPSFHVVASDAALYEDEAAKVPAKPGGDPYTTKHHVVQHAAERQRPPRCGWCCFRPACLQVGYKWQLGLVVMCWFAFLQGFILHGITPVNSGSLERRFKISSVDIGWFNGAIELSAACSTILFSYLADRAHKPRWLMISALLFAVGCFVMSLPHYIAEPYDGNGRSGSSLCRIGSSQVQASTNETLGECSSVRASSWLNVLIVGNVITGVGAGIIFTVGVAFIDDFSDKSNSPLHIGIMYLCVSAGAAVGFAGGSAMLQLDVNFNRADWPQFKGNKDFNPNYVGAWWLGYAIGAAGFGTVALAFSCFDYEMPETAALRLQKGTETHKTSFKLGDDASIDDKKPKIVQILLKFVRSLVRLVLNPVLVFVTIAYVTHGLMADGVQPFFVKIIQTQYVMNEAKAGLTIAIMIVIAIGSGSFVSGVVLKRADFSLRTLLLLVFGLISAVTALGFGFFLHCPQAKISGITARYNEFTYYDPIPKYNSANLAATCNARCGCSTDHYQPACHPKLGLQFFSPCHGGCKMETSVLRQGRNISIFANCDCLASLFFAEQNLTASQQTQFMTVLQSGVTAAGAGQMPTAAGNVTSPLVLQQLQAQMARLAVLQQAYRNFSMENVLANGTCDTSCANFYGAMIILFFTLFLGYFTTVPLCNIVMRCVPKEDRTFALSFYQSIGRFLGTIPGPIMVGAIIDRVCIFREPPGRCDGTDVGPCFGYNSNSLASWLVGMFVGLHVIAALCYLIAFFLYKPPNGQTLREYFQRKKQMSRIDSSSEETYDNPTYVTQGAIDKNKGSNPNDSL